MEGLDGPSYEIGKIISIILAITSHHRARTRAGTPLIPEDDTRVVTAEDEVEDIFARAKDRNCRACTRARAKANPRSVVTSYVRRVDRKSGEQFTVRPVSVDCSLFDTTRRLRFDYT